jgi:hypothetical protein
MTTWIGMLDDAAALLIVGMAMAYLVHRFRPRSPSDAPEREAPLVPATSLLSKHRDGREPEASRDLDNR